jgi:signal transduction histidine kinase
MLTSPVRLRVTQTRLPLIFTGSPRKHNTLKHGKAKRIMITYTRDDHTKRTTLSISDDGSGMRQLPRPGVITKGMGLQIMRYRAEAVGGKLVVARGINGGTVVSISLGEDTNPD